MTNDNLVHPTQVAAKLRRQTSDAIYPTMNSIVEQAYDYVISDADSWSKRGATSIKYHFIHFERLSRIRFNEAVRQLTNKLVHHGLDYRIKWDWLLWQYVLIVSWD